MRGNLPKGGPRLDIPFRKWSRRDIGSGSETKGDPGPAPDRTPDMPDKTPAPLDAATVADALDLSQLALIGLMLSPGGNAALVRLPGGQVHKIAPGTRIGSATVHGIDAQGMTLARGGSTMHLSLPGG